MTIRSRLARTVSVWPIISLFALISLPGPASTSADEKTPPAAPNEKAACVTGREAIRKALETPVTVRAVGKPLIEVMHLIGEQIRVSTLPDARILDDTGISMDAPVSLDVAKMPAREALDYLLRQHELTILIRDNHVLVTTPEAADIALDVVIYDVTDLVMRQDSHGDWHSFDLDRLVDLLTSTVKPTSWDTVGGGGGIRGAELPLSAVLVCSQSQEVHREIERLLADLRKVESQRRGASRRPVPTAEAMLRRSVSYGIVPSDRFDPGPELGQNEQRDTLVCQANLMGWDVFHLLKGRSEGNLLFSPASAALCLGALRAGAQDRTGAELETVLHLRTSGRGGLDRALSEPEITPAFAAFLQSMLAKEATHGYDLRIAGSLTLAGRKNYPPAFSEAARRLGIETVDCASTDPAAFQKKVEAWTSEAMRSMFAKGAAVQPATMATGGAMRVVVAFHGNWQSPFDAQATKPAEFHAGAKRWQVPMMRSLEPLNYLEIDGVQIVEKSYRGHTVSLIVLLPRDRPAALVALEKRLNAATIENWLNRSREATVDFRLPRFRLNFAVDLRAPVIDLGLSTAFEKSKANFQGINNSVGTSPWLDGFDQLVEVRIDEGGAPAKAEPQPIMGGGVSPMMGGGFSGDMARMLWSAEVPVHADHPFVFLIRDLRTGAIVFIGRYAGPDETITVGDDRLRLGE